MKKVLSLISVLVGGVCCILPVLTVSCSSDRNTNSIRYALENYVRSRDAEIGVCVIIDSRDTIRINNNTAYPMNSVMKLYQAVTLADYMHNNRIPLDSVLDIKAAELRQDTYSPLRDSIGTADCSMPIAEIIRYSLQFSDNNACDILFNHLLDTKSVDAYIRNLRIGEFAISADENAMHRNPELVAENRTHPDAAAALINMLYTDEKHFHEYRRFITEVLDACSTGKNRLSKPLVGTEAIIGHKTGTGFEDGNGRPQGINDVGFVRLPDGQYYAIAVFVKSSQYDMAATEQIIADISETVYRHFAE